MRKVGKRIGKYTYIHKSALLELSSVEYFFLMKAYEYLDDYKDFDYQIAKFSMDEGRVTFIQSQDWDTAREPIVGDRILVDENNQVKFSLSNNKQIYHHKWMFVKDDYDGFDVEESKKWSEKWQNHPYVLRMLEEDKSFKSRIGYKDFWDDVVIMVERFKYITTKKLDNVNGIEGDYTQYSISKGTLLAPIYYETCVIQFCTEYGIEIELSRTNPKPNDPCNYDKYFTLPDGVQYLE